MKSENTLDTIHSAFTTSDEQISTIITKAVGQQALKIVPMHAGYDSEVYRVDTSNKSFVLKVNHEQSVPYASEAWAMEQARKVGVPVAAVYYCDIFPFHDAQREVIVQSLVTGTKFQTRRSVLNTQEFEKGLRNMGEVLARLHSICVDGAYQRHKDGSWDFPDWSSLVDSTIENRLKEHDLHIRGGLTEQQLTDIFTLFDRSVDNLKSMQPVLNHGDYLPDHVFTDDQLDITGVIDFGSFQGASPTHDFAFIMLMGPNIPLKPILDGYGQGIEKDLETIRAQALLLALGHLAHKVKKNFKPETEFVAKQINRMLERL